MLYGEAFDRAIRNSTQMRRKEGVIVRYDDECDENNNSYYECAANSATTSINHYML